LTIDPSLAGPQRDGATAVAAEPRQPALSPKTAVTLQPGAAVAPPPGTGSAAIATAPPDKIENAASVPPPPAKPAVKAPVAPPATEKPAAKIEPPAAAVKKAEPPLDMTALKTRLRDTKSIGVFTKLALKSQVDDLVQQFRTYYESGKSSNIGSLRQAYDMLVMKVLAVVQDNDPSLAHEIAGSREAIWGMLADPQKFNAMI
jgi:hypothetical protein